MVRRMWIFAVVLLALAVLAAFLVWWALAQPFVRARAPRHAVHADAARLETDVRLLAETFHPRDWVHTENLDRAAAHVGEVFRASGARVRVQEYEADAWTYRNVIGVFGPETPEEREGATALPRVVVGAHYDTAGELPGADDNASGVAGLLELARLLGEAPEGTLAVPVELVAFTLEEPPFFRTTDMGSVQHAKALAARGAEVRAMFSLEMIGCFEDADGTQAFPTGLLSPFYPKRGDFIAVIGRIGQGGLVRRVKGAMRGANDLPVHSMNGLPSIPGVDLSDHRSYWARGFPAVMITDTSFYRNPRYHTAEDTPDTLDYRRMAQVVEGVHAAVLDLAAEESR